MYNCYIFHSSTKKATHTHTKVSRIIKHYIIFQNMVHASAEEKKWKRKKINVNKHYASIIKAFVLH